MPTWSDQMKQACDNGMPCATNDRKSRVDAIMDARRQRLADGPFQKLENKLAHEKNGPSDPAAVAAKVGREKLGQAEMTRRAEAGRKDSDDAEWNESKHPREGGKCAAKGGESTGGNASSGHPSSIKYRGKELHHTGKAGTNRNTGEPSAEYEYYDPKTGNATGQRAWRSKSGKVEEDPKWPTGGKPL